MRAAQTHGAELRLGRVSGVVRRGARVVGVEVDGEAIEGDAVVIAMGPGRSLPPPGCHCLRCSG